MDKVRAAAGSSAPRSSTALLLAGLLGLAALSGCQQRPTTVEPVASPTTTGVSPGMAPPDVGQLAILDRDFVIMAASAGLMEIEASRLALERSRNNDLRAFALRMVDEHSAANKELQGHVSRLGMAVPQLLPMHAEELQRLRALEGELFDREYVVQIGVTGHVETTAIYERAATTVSDPELQAFAGRMLPILRNHLQMSEKLAGQLNVPPDRLHTARKRPSAEMQTTIGTTGTTGTTRATTPEPTTAPAAGGNTTGAAAVPGGGVQTGPTPSGAADRGSGK
jgi:putative membrane protein